MDPTGIKLSCTLSKPLYDGLPAVCHWCWLYICIFVVVVWCLLLYLAYFAILMASCVEIVSCCGHVPQSLYSGI